MTIVYGLCSIALVVLAVWLHDLSERPEPEQRGFEVIVRKEEP